MDNMRKYVAEAIGTFWLTFAGCGSAVIAAGAGNSFACKDLGFDP
jgi:glycerol uptake facilitator-like aquaporin